MIYDLAGTTAMRRLTFGGRNRFPVWSPDGRRLAFQSDRDGTPAIYVQNADGGGAAERLTTGAQGVSQTPDSWSPDGRTLLFSEQKGDTFYLMASSVSEKRAVTFGGVQSLQPADAVFSPAYGRLKAALERRGSRIEDFDVAIAAHALALGATLVTSNVEHMARVPGIRVEDWGE